MDVQKRLICKHISMTPSCELSKVSNII